MKLYRASEIRELDARAIAAGTPGLDLMSRACRELAEELQFFAGKGPHSVRIYCGPGNNGGDGLGLGLILQRAGWRVQCRVAVHRDQIRGDALGMLEWAEAEQVPIDYCLNEEGWRRSCRLQPPVDWVVDALLGTGSRGAPEGNLAVALQVLQQERALKVAVDIPSGLHADTGLPFDERQVLRADLCLSLGAPKRGFSLPASATYTGCLSILELGFSEEELGRSGTGRWQMLSLQEAMRLLPVLPADAHKGERGRVSLLGGSHGMSGALVLSGRAALASGAGLVTLQVQARQQLHLDAAWAELMVGDRGEHLPVQARLFGPGMRPTRAAQAELELELKWDDAPVLLDAGALRVLAGLPGWMLDLSQPRLLTPHAGEMADLLGWELTHVLSEPDRALEEAQARSGGSVLLKGPRSRMAMSDGSRWVNPSGNPGMASAGSGDVLSGILLALMGQGLSAPEALRLGCWVHGRAGDLASLHQGRHAMSAESILNHLPQVWQHLGK